MAYDAERSYLGPLAIAAQNIIATASGQVVAGATTVLFPVAEQTQIVSIAGVVTATPSSFPAGVKPFIVVGTNTTTATGAITQASGSAAMSTFTFNSNLTVSSGTPVTVGLVATGTASATETAGATNIILGCAPQYV